MSLATTSDVLSWLGISSSHSADDDFIVAVLMASMDRMFADYLGFSPAQATRTEYYPSRVTMNQRDNLIDGWERAGSNKVVPIDRYRSERRIIALRHLPVRSIASVYENPDAWMTSPPTFDAGHLLTAGTNYMLDVDEDGLSRTGFLINNTGPWSSGDRAVKVTYVGGYTASELAADYGVFRHAYLEAVQIAYNACRVHRFSEASGRMVGVMTSESLGDWSASYDALTSQKLYGLENHLPSATMKRLECYRNYSMFV